MCPNLIILDAIVKSLFRRLFRLVKVYLTRQALIRMMLFDDQLWSVVSKYSLLLHYAASYGRVQTEPLIPLELRRIKGLCEGHSDGLRRQMRGRPLHAIIKFITMVVDNHIIE